MLVKLGLLELQLKSECAAPTFIIPKKDGAMSLFLIVESLTNIFYVSPYP